MKMIAGLMRSTRAATAVEYGLLLALIFLAAVGAVSNFGTAAINMWTNVSTAAEDAM